MQLVMVALLILIVAGAGLLVLEAHAEVPHSLLGAILLLELGSIPHPLTAQLMILRYAAPMEPTALLAQMMSVVAGARHNPETATGTL